MFRLTHQVLIFSAVAAMATAYSDQTVAQSDTSKAVTDGVDWKSFLQSHDLVWKRLPKNWKESPFLGNGEQGTMGYQADRRTFRWDIGCSAAHDHRPFAQDDLKEKNVVVLNRGRHFIGHLNVKLPQDVTRGTARLALYDAEATGTLAAANGKVRWTSLVHAHEPVMYFELNASGNLAEATFEYVPEAAQNPRAIRAKTPRHPANPQAVVKQLEDGVQTAVHNLHAGGQTAVAWLEKETTGQRQLWLSVQHSFPSKNAVSKAIAAVRKAAATNHDQWVASHREWWHRYYPESFLSTGDPYWDSFYWIQQYKLACATRDKGWIIDNQGPWLQPTAWNALWWNLNVQLSHSGFATSNRRELGTALSHRLDVCRDNLVRNVAKPFRSDSSAIGRTTSNWDLLGYAGQPGTGRPPMDPQIGRECGNLLWALHNVDLEYRYWNDADVRDRILYPLLVRAVNYYRHFLVEKADGRLHLPETYSPEYRRAADCTYDLDLLRWGVGRLLELANEKGLTKKQQPLIVQWKAIQENLVAVQVNETGRMIGKNVALTGGHRHWSHLLAIYPLRTLTPESTANRQLIQRSLDHWHSFKRGGAGYSKTGGSCIAALLGDGDRALTLLNGLKGFLQKNTFYTELSTLPVIETPLHGATAMQDMLLQSWGGRLRVFPAVPASWPDVQFHQLRGEGAYLVSARREQGATQWVSVQADSKGQQKGTAQRSVEVHPQIKNAQWAASAGANVTAQGRGVFTVQLSRGANVLFWPAGQAQPKPTVNSVPPRGKPHRFGLNE